MTEKEKIMNLQKKLIKLYKEIDELKGKKNSSDSDFKAWKTDVQLCLSGLYGEKSIQLKNFNNRRFSPIIIGGNPDWHEPYVKDLEITQKEFERYIGDFEDESENTNAKEKRKINNKVFIVHGHDGELKEKVARRLEQQGIEAIILSEQANRGKTIIEKLELYSDVYAAIILFTSDDLGVAKEESGHEKYRARQNVVFEAGYFMGYLGRENVIMLADKNVEIPGDLSGMVYTTKDNWEFEMLKELNAAGMKIDMNKLLS